MKHDLIKLSRFLRANGLNRESNKAMSIAKIAEESDSEKFQKEMLKRKKQNQLDLDEIASSADRHKGYKIKENNYAILRRFERFKKFYYDLIREYEENTSSPYLDPAQTTYSGEDAGLDPVMTDTVYEGEKIIPEYLHEYIAMNNPDISILSDHLEKTLPPGVLFSDPDKRILDVILISDHLNGNMTFFNPSGLPISLSDLNRTKVPIMQYSEMNPSMRHEVMFYATFPEIEAMVLRNHLEVE